MAKSEEVVIPLVVDGSNATPTLRELETEVKKLNKELKDLPSGSSEFAKKSQELDQATARLNNVRNSTRQAREEGTKLVDSIRGLGPGGQIIGNVADGFENIKTQAGGSIAGLRGVGVAMASIPILAIVAALTSLVLYFKRTDEGATKLEGIMTGLKFALGQLIKPFVDFGKFISDAFENPKKAGEEFLQFLKDQFINRVMAIVTLGKAIKEAFSGDFTQAAKLATDALGQFTLGVNNITDKVADLAKGMADAAKTGYNLAAAFDALADAERDFSVTQKETENQIERLLLQSKNRGISEQGRLSLLDKASAKEEALHAQQVKFANENLRLIKLENEQLRSTGEDTDEMAQKETDAKLKILELEGQSLVLQEKISNRRAQLQEQIEADNASELAELEKLRGAQESYSQFLEKGAQKQRQARLDNIQASEEEEKLALEKKFFTQLGSQKEYETELFKIERKAKEKRLAEIKGDDAKSRSERAKLQADILRGEKNFQSKQVEEEKKTTDLKGKLRESNYQNASSALQMGIQLLSQDEEARKEYGAAIKALAVADIAVNLAKQISAINVAAAANPLNALTFGAAGTTQAAIQIGLAIASAALQTATVVNTQYAKGGRIYRPSISRGATNAFSGIVEGSRHGARYGDAGIAMIDRITGREIGEMEGTEIVLAGGVSANPKLARMASQINVAGGGRAFAEGGAVGNVSKATDDSAKLHNAFIAYANKVDAWQRQIKVVNSVVDFNQKSAEYSKMVNNSTL